MATAETADDADPIVHLKSSHDAVSVEKALVQASDGTVGVWLRLTTRGSRERSVTIAERLPDAVDHGDVGLHPEYGRRSWTRADGGLEFSTTVGTGATVTMYAVRGIDVVPVELATPPEVVDVQAHSRSLSR